MATPTPYLTPSEMVYLNGERFAQQGGMFNKTRLLNPPYEVNAIQLAQNVIAAALLANEQYRALSLEIRPKKGPLGIGSSDTLYAVPAGPAPQWPPATLEADLPTAAARMAGYGKNDVFTTVYHWLGKDYGAPFEAVFERIKASLAERVLLGIHEEKKLKIFTVRTYVIPDSTRALATSSPWMTVQQTLQYTMQSRPLVYQKLMDDIKKAVSARQEKTDTGTD